MAHFSVRRLMRTSVSFQNEADVLNCWYSTQLSFMLILHFSYGSEVGVSSRTYCRGSSICGNSCHHTAPPRRDTLSPGTQSTCCLLPSLASLRFWGKKKEKWFWELQVCGSQEEEVSFYHTFVFYEHICLSGWASFNSVKFWSWSWRPARLVDDPICCCYCILLNISGCLIKKLRLALLCK